MRTSLLFLLCFVTFPGHAEDRSQIQDGTFWKGLTPSEKVSFMEGYTNGYFSGEVDAVVAFASSSKHADPSTNAALKRDRPEKITYGTLIDGVDTCYGDFRNSSLDISDCVAWTVRGIRGESDTSREAFLAAMRRLEGEQH
jgi:hypothetical protein